MTKRKDEWIRVRSESELRAGMCVELRTCKWCGRRERFFLTEKAMNDTGRFRSTDGSVHASQSAYKWRTMTRCPTASNWTVFEDNNIPEGRLFRLSDSQLTEDETTRQLERVR